VRSVGQSHRIMHDRKPQNQSLPQVNEKDSSRRRDLLEAQRVRRAPQDQPGTASRRTPFCAGSSEAL
jgi:hypothetical protein